MQTSCQSDYFFCRALPSNFFAGRCPAGHNLLILLILRRTSNHSINLPPIVGGRLNCLRALRRPTSAFWYGSQACAPSGFAMIFYRLARRVSPFEFLRPFHRMSPFPRGGDSGDERKISRVPRYQKVLKVVGLCDFQVKPRLFEKRRGLVKRLKPLLMKKGLGLMENAGQRPAKKSRSLPTKTVL